MTSNIKELEEKALKLSVKDRGKLIRQLIQSIEEEELDENVEEAWIIKAEDRFEKYKQGLISEKSADQVFKDAKANLK